MKNQQALKYNAPLISSLFRWLISTQLVICARNDYLSHYSHFCREVKQKVVWSVMTFCSFHYKNVYIKSSHENLGNHSYAISSTGRNHQNIWWGISATFRCVERDFYSYFMRNFYQQRVFLGLQWNDPFSLFHMLCKISKFKEDVF